MSVSIERLPGSDSGRVRYKNILERRVLGLPQIKIKARKEPGSVFTVAYLTAILTTGSPFILNIHIK